MPPWQIKSAIQGCVSLLPFGEHLNRFFQLYVSQTLQDDYQFFYTKWWRCLRHLTHYQKHCPQPKGGFTALELGTGWFPMVPVGLFLCGAKRVWTIDITPRLSPARVIKTLEVYRDLADQGHLEGVSPRALHRLQRVLNNVQGHPRRQFVERILAALNITPLIKDARRTGFSKRSIDLIVSNNTLEHVHPKLLPDIFKEFKRIASPAGIMSHFIDMGDMYANFDKSITPFNYLRFSDRVWPIFNSKFNYVNRLRITDFRDLHQKAGWQLLQEDNKKGSPEELTGIPLADRFRRYDLDDLLVYESWIVSVPQKNTEYSQ